MGRKRKARWIDFQPGVTYFKPRGVSMASLEEVGLTLDEIEAIRLSDLEEQDQTKAAKKMKISQSTFQRILTVAHRKIAEALVKGKAIKVEGGEVIMPRFGRGVGRGIGRGQGRGRMSGPFAAGPGGICICTNPECKNEISHQAGVPCYQTKCPKCSSPMVRKR
jgi:predicted DNA-binding protein (UPF0251 family)